MILCDWLWNHWTVWGASKTSLPWVLVQLCIHSDTVSVLQRESGIIYEEKAVMDLKSSIMNGEWQQVCSQCFHIL